MSLIPLSKLPDKGITYSRNYIDRLIKEGRFPRPIFLSARRRAFVEAEIDGWLQDRIAERDDASNKEAA